MLLLVSFIFRISSLPRKSLNLLLTLLIYSYSCSKYIEVVYVRNSYFKCYLNLIFVWSNLLSICTIPSSQYWFWTCMFFWNTLLLIDKDYYIMWLPNIYLKYDLFIYRTNKIRSWTSIKLSPNVHFTFSNLTYLLLKSFPNAIFYLKEFSQWNR